MVSLLPEASAQLQGSALLQGSVLWHGVGLWHGVAQWVRLPDGAVWPRRVTRELASTAYNPHFEHQTQIPAGVHARFTTDAAGLRIRGRIPGPADAPLAPGVSAPQPLTATLTVIADGAPLPPLLSHLPGGSSQAQWELGAGLKVVEIWLPHAQAWVVEEIELLGATSLQAAPKRSTWVAYGSSITQCAAANEPWQTWPALVAREQNLELHSLGMGGQCHLDDAIELTIIAARPQYVSLCLGINIYGRGSFDERSLGSAVHGFIRRVLSGVPDTRFAVITPIFAGWRENKPNHVGLSVAQIREIIGRVAQQFTDSGRLEIIDGLSVLGAEDTALLADDDLHPTHAGYGEIARRISPMLARAWQLPTPEILTPEIRN